MNICQIVPCFPYHDNIEKNIVEKGYHIGGVERHVLEITKSLIKRGHSLTVITTKSPLHEKYTEIKGLNIVRIPHGISLYSSFLPVSIFKYFNSNEFDIIHAHTPNPAIADFACIKNARRVPFILTYHNDIIKGGVFGKIISNTYNSTLGKYLLSNSDLIIGTTKSYISASCILKDYSEKLEAIPNGVDSNLFYNELPLKVKHELNIPLESNVVLFVGALEEYKGTKYLITAFKEVLRRDPNCYLIIVGSGSLRGELEILASSLNISEKVVFAGYIKDEDKPYYYAASDVFVLPSISEKEGFGIVQLEAMAASKPVICTDLPGVRDVDENRICSISVPPKNVVKLSDAIVSILKDPSLKRQLGANGRKLVNDKYTWDRIAEKLEKRYLKVISEQSIK